MKVDVLLCADWAKEARKRAVYAADVRERAVFRLACVGGWSVGAVLAEAERLKRQGAVLATFDAPLGVPVSYLALMGRARTFLEFLITECQQPEFFAATSEAKDWSVNRPFFSVPKGVGGLTSYRDAARACGVDLWRSIDKKAGAKPLFVKSGIPGSVGCATESLWREIGALLTNGRAFKLWPFEGDLDSLVAARGIVIGEMYPRAAYATALLNGPVALRPRVSLAKTDAEVRRSAIAALTRAEWVRGHGVRIDGLREAQSSEDDFDACVTAAALLRCALEELPFCEPASEMDSVEGGILGTGSVNLDLKERTWRAAGQAQCIESIIDI